MSSTHAIRPSQWELDHFGQIRYGLEYIAEHDEAPDTPLWDMLVFRHGLNAARFDHYHPLAGNALDQLAIRRPADPICPPPYDHKAPCIPFVASTECRPDVPLNPQTVAEPGSVISLMVGVVLLAAYAVGRN